MIRPLYLLPRACGALLALAGVACDDISSFQGEFQGSIVDGTFVRRCFAPATTATLDFDPDLAVAASAGDTERNRLSTSDGLFEQTELHPLDALPQDQLSEFDFPGPKRRRNYLLFARPTTGAMAGRDVTVVVSLLDDEGIELRVLGRAPEPTTPCPADQMTEPPDEPGPRQLFGVFRLGK